MRRTPLPPVLSPLFLILSSILKLSILIFVNNIIYSIIVWYFPSQKHVYFILLAFTASSSWIEKFNGCPHSWVVRRVPLMQRHPAPSADEIRGSHYSSKKCLKGEENWWCKIAERRAGRVGLQTFGDICHWDENTTRDSCISIWEAEDCIERCYGSYLLRVLPRASVYHLLSAWGGDDVCCR